MKQIISAIILFISIILPQSKAQIGIADVIYFNAKIYTVDKDLNVFDAIAIKDGKIAAIGYEKDVRTRFSSYNEINLKGKSIFPGFYDAHGHFLGYSRNLLTANLWGTKTKKDALDIVKKFASNHKGYWITGRGWDQNDWPEKSYPSKKDLDSLFPDRPVYLVRVDGHAAWVNTKAIELAKITAGQTIKGGEIMTENAQVTGVLIDEATELVSRIIPATERAELIKSIQVVQDECFAYGVTSLADAGLPYEDVMLLDSLQKAGILDMRIYAMLTPEPKNFENFVRKGVYKTDKLNVRSIKVYADGALGSRGACLLHPYSDRSEHSGLLFKDYMSFYSICHDAAMNGFQVNTHCIGDSAHRTVLLAYAAVIGRMPGHRWRIEHAQVTAASDLIFYEVFKIIPSVQPTHATSDMYWAGERLGSGRLKTAYTYKQLLDKRGLIALGTDFPVESINPFNTFYAAVARKDLKGYPEGGFQLENALSRIETLKGMTIWAAYAAFEENEKGSLEVGKWADLIVLDRDIMTIPENEIPLTRVEMTMLGGKVVWKK